MSRTQPRFSYDQHEHNDSSSPDIEELVEVLSDPKSTELAVPFVGKWQSLVSQTNWEKGKLIQQWRDASEKSGLSSVAYSDEAWARRVGGVSPQHVGRLRRVYERFGTSYATFSDIYWTHFLAAMDWHDAEMWLEGASQSKWSVAEMRTTRWQALGGDPNQTPREEDVIVGTMDEDFAPLSEMDSDEDSDAKNRIGSTGPLMEGPDFGDQGSDSSRNSVVDDDGIPFEVGPVSEDPLATPFASLPALPVDVAESMEQFKLAIIRHRSNGWIDITRDQTLQVIEALRQFVMARAE